MSSRQNNYVDLRLKFLRHKVEGVATHYLRIPHYTISPLIRLSAWMLLMVPMLLHTFFPSMTVDNLPMKRSQVRLWLSMDLLNRASQYCK